MLYILDRMYGSQAYAVRHLVPDRLHSSRSKRDGRSAQLRGTARKRLLDAALLEFREHGYAATSLQAIAQRAGLTKGAIYWSFQDKRDLFLALVEERLDAPARELMRITETAPPEIETAPLVSQGFAEIVRNQPDLLLLAIEHWTLAIREESVRRDFVKRQRELTDAIARTLQARHVTLGIPLTYPARGLGTAIIALSLGLAMEALAEPDAVPDALFGDILGLIYDGLVHRAENSP
jgi:AcrR family transcriptional regulator